MLQCHDDRHGAGGSLQDLRSEYFRNSDKMNDLWTAAEAFGDIISKLKVKRNKPKYQKMTLHTHIISSSIISSMRRQKVNTYTARRSSTLKCTIITQKLQ